MGVGSCPLTQISLTTNYFTDFGTSDITAWTNNSTVAGWYMQSTWRGHQNITASSPSNSGGFYSYECAGNNDQKIGGRASGSADPVYYGVRLRNTSGSTINYLEISYDWFQFSLAQNGGNVNTISVHYRTGATVTALTGGTWTAVPALNFSAPMSSATSGSGQLNGYPCTQSGSRSACLAVTIPNNQEIMLRWSDPDDGANDPHLGIDNVFIGIASDPGCITILPAALSDFSLSKKEQMHQLSWVSGSEINLDYYEVEHSSDGLHFSGVGIIDARGNEMQSTHYSFEHAPFAENGNGSTTHYYRLRITDLDGNYTYSPIRSVDENMCNILPYNKKIHLNQIHPMENKVVELLIHDVSGRLIYRGLHQNNDVIEWNETGIFIVSIPENNLYTRIFTQ